MARGMAKDSYHVVPHARGWAVKRSDAGRASNVFDSKSEAMRRGKQLARNAETELVVHGEDGRVSNPNSYGGDSPRVRDRRR
jgi:uncharacterized protein YdaT